MASCATSRVSGLGARGRGARRGRRTVQCRADTREWVYREAPGLATGITVEEAARRVAAGELTLVDIRAGYQRERARVPGSIHVPLFVEDQRNDPSNFVRRNFFQYGNPMMALYDYRMCVRNENFVEDLAATGLSKDQPLLFACQEGLRCKMAADEMGVRGYKDTNFLIGGFKADLQEKFPSEGDFPLKDAAKAGAGQFLKVQNVAIAAAIFSTLYALTVYAPEQAGDVAETLGL